MDDLRLGRLVRVMRHRRRLRQADLARRAGVGRTAVSAIELGRARDLRLGTIRAVAGGLGAGLEVAVHGLGAEVDRVLDERHARLVGAVAAWLSAVGWEVRAETSYSEWGERGSIDLLGWHASTRTLVVVEVKTDLVSVEATLRKHDEKARLAPLVVARRWGWRPLTVAGMLVLPTDRTQRRRVAEHAAVLDLAYPARSRRMRAWCRRPFGAISGLVFLTDVAPGGSTTRSGRGERVRRPSAE